ncbi:MAG: dephospho-CoA kinase [Bacteroidetes bacterium]|nr:dephospho-CoA kinase [Bacteroidota bacterium]
MVKPILDVRTLGVTGGIGSGKSTVCAYLEDLGATIFEADRVARDLMESSDQIREAVIKSFGGKSYKPEGHLNRPWLAARVFRDEVRLAELNAIVHPRVGEAFDRLKQQLHSGLLVHEAALIYESGLGDHLDAVCVVSAPKDVRIERVMARDGIRASEVHARMQRQLPQEETEGRADVVLVNAGDQTELHRKTKKLYELAMDQEILSPENFKAFRRL